MEGVKGLGVSDEVFLQIDSLKEGLSPGEETCLHGSRHAQSRGGTAWKELSCGVLVGELAGEQVNRSNTHVIVSTTY